MIEMKLLQIQIDETRPEQVIVLKEDNGSRVLPIIIGMSEARAIYDRVYSAKYPRPMTHDLIKSIIENLDSRADRLVIDRLDEGTFYAKLILKNKENRDVFIDIRPSDGIAVALRMNVSIFVDESVLKNSIEA
jgi:bifunctional DNase/RNase